MLNPRTNFFNLCAAVALCAIALGLTSMADEEKNIAAMKRFQEEIKNKGENEDKTWREFNPVLIRISGRVERNQLFLFHE